MKKHGIGSRLLALLLVLAMVLPMVPMQALAAKGDLYNTEDTSDATGLTGNIDTNDTISLPIQILDYEADGMLFEYAEANDILTPADFGATYACDYTNNAISSSASTAVYYCTSDYDSSLQNVGADTQYMRIGYWNSSSADHDGTDYITAFNTYYDDATNTTYKLSQIRYLVFVYRARNISRSNMSFSLYTSSTRYSNPSSSYQSDSFTITTGTDWTYEIVDLYTTGASASTTVYSMLMDAPITSSSNYIDVAYVTYFDNMTQAQKFAEYAVTKGSNNGDNRAFGLLRSSRNQAGTTAFDSIIAKTETVSQLETYNSGASVDLSTVTGLGYTLLGTFAANGIANVGLLEPTLQNGKPVYKQEVVAYLAELLQHALEIPERTDDGWKNYRYISSDLAKELRTRITGGLGTYPTGTDAAGLIGTWEQCQGNIDTYYDAAYFLLNNLFIDNSYNTPQDTPNNSEYYDYLVLSAGIDADTGQKVYVFDGGFTKDENGTTAVKYDTTAHTIQNDDASYKTQFYYDSSNVTTLNPFLPITDMNDAEGQTKTPYYQDDGVVNTATTKDTLVNRDYNFALYSSGEFVYHADDELFFDFEGDDDVYLFINDTLVMDIGSAHSIDGVRFELNDYVEAAKAGTLVSPEQNENLALVEGDTYNFDFFYMERHSYGSNMRINTNIKVTDPSMTTEKTAYVDGTQIEYGGIVNAASIVEYGFSITNAGGENLYNIGFTDNDIGVKLDPVNGLTITGDRVYSLDGTPLQPDNTVHRDKLVKELTAVLSGENRETGQVYDPITVTFADNNELIYFLQNITSDQALESGGGLWRGSTVAFRGIGYMLSEEQVKSGWFDNTVFATATNKTASKTLQGRDNMRVCIPSDPMYYQWAGHELQIPLDKLIADINTAANQEGNALSGKVSNLTPESVTNMVEITKGGYGVDYPQVNIDKETAGDIYNVKYVNVNYTSVGSYVFYLKIYYSVNGVIGPVSVPVVINVTDVEPSVFVLDYGLKADLAEDGGKELFKNDTLTVPGRDTEHSILAVGSGGAYSPNEITFTSSSKVEGTYGDFTTTNGNLLYTPDAFLEGKDTVQIAVNVYESGTTPSKITGTLDINNEVEMYKNVTVLPATVVYYEDDFPAITYIDQAENTFTRVGSSLDADDQQGVDQDENYGSDDYYDDDAATSAGTLTTITIGQEGPVAKFTFHGTGFELISRTNADDSATLDVAVFKGTAETVSYANYQYIAADSTGAALTMERLIPVITEFDNGGDGGAEEIYQVPVIRVDDLTLDTYTVVIGGVPAYDWANSTYPDKMVVIPTNLYIDGLRIFQPLGATHKNYTTDENGAVFTEIRDLIVEGKAGVADHDGAKLTVSSGTVTWTENRNGVYHNGTEFTGNEVNSVNDYLLYGPNNEVYMEGTFTNSALYFGVKGTGTLQVGIHAVDLGLFNGSASTGMNAPIYYGIQKADGTYGWEHLVPLTSGTEQYYTIDYTKCPYDATTGVYTVILKVDYAGEDTVAAMASYTSIKTVGIEIVNMETEAATYRYNNGMLEKWDGTAWVPTWDEQEGTSTNNVVPAFEVLSTMLSTSVLALPEEPAHPFADVEDGAFYYDAMLWALDNGITNGTSETTFSPNKEVTRAEVVTFLWRAAGSPEPVTNDNPFVDVAENDFYYDAVLWAVENGITNGIDAAHFGPLSICNRAQVVTFLYRTAGEPAVTGTGNPFTDVAEKDFYYNAVLWAVGSGVTNGIDAETFGSNANCNRAQIVTFLYRAQ